MDADSLKIIGTDVLNDDVMAASGVGRHRIGFPRLLRRPIRVKGKIEFRFLEDHIHEIDQSPLMVLMR